MSACGVSRYEGNWHETIPQSVGTLRHLFETKALGDVTLHFTDSQGNDRGLVAHKFILAMRCPFFEQFFENNPGYTFKIYDIDADAFDMILRFCYLGDQSLEGIENFDLTLKILKAANMLKMEYVKEYCVKCLKDIWMKNRHHRSILSRILEANSELQDPNLESFLVAQYSQFAVIDSGDLRNFQVNPLMKVLEKFSDLKGCTIRCLHTFKMVHMWAKVQSQDKPQEIRKIMEPFLPFFEFLVLTKKQFSEVVVPSDVLTSREIVTITKNLEKEGGDRKVVGQLPYWCNLCYKYTYDFPQKEVCLIRAQTWKYFVSKMKPIWSLKFSTQGPAMVFWKFVIAVTFPSLQFQGKITVNRNETFDITVEQNKYYEVQPKTFIHLKEGKNDIEVKVELVACSVIPREQIFVTGKYLDTCRSEKGDSFINIKPTKHLAFHSIWFGQQNKFFLSRNNSNECNVA